MSKKRQICFSIEEDLLKQMEEIRDNTGLPISRQIELELLGYSIKKSDESYNYNETQINEQFECVKHGNPGKQCGKQCILFNIDDNKFVVCKFFKLKNEYGIFKM